MQARPSDAVDASLGSQGFRIVSSTLALSGPLTHTFLERFSQRLELLNYLRTGCSC